MIKNIEDTQPLPILSICGWNYGKCEWGWNAWTYLDATAPSICLEWSHRKILKYLRNDLQLLSERSKGKVAIEDDGYNLVVINKNTHEPLYAIEYGAI